MNRTIALQRTLLAVACALAALLALVLVACSGSSSGTQEGVVESRTDSDIFDQHYVEEEFDYSDGIHHAELVFDGYEDRPLSIEIYSHSAPVTAERFCRLVDAGFYNGKPVYWILNEMYLRIGSTSQNDDYLITGEYEESDVKNSNSLKRGVIAMNRAVDEQQSDASSLIVFMSDLSFLTSKYAGFAKIVENYEVIEDIARRTTAGDGDERIVIDANGRIIDEAQYPHIQTITIID